MPKFGLTARGSGAIFYVMAKARRRKYKYVAWREEGIWVVHAPAVPEVYGFGNTIGAACDDFAEALALLLDYLDDLGEPAPRQPAMRVGEIVIGPA